MSVTGRTSSDYEAEADRVRREIDETVKKLRSRLAPSHLAAEAAASAGLADANLAGGLERVIRRHPIPAAIAALGVSLWAFASLRNRAKRQGVAGLASPLRESSESLVGSATRVFRERAALKRRELVRAAQVRIADGAERLSDEVERKLDDVVDQVPGGRELSPLIACAIQIALTAAVEGLLRKDPPGPQA